MLCYNIIHVFEVRATGHERNVRGRKNMNTFKFFNFLLYIARRDVYSAPHFGSVAERLKAPVLKTGDPKGF